MHIDVPINNNGHDFVVGDIHGHYSLLKSELKRVGFNPSKDRLFSVGDIIDRGPKSEACLALLDKPWFFMVLGNHEQMMMDAILFGKGFNWAIEYGKWSKRFSYKELEDWAGRLSELPVSMTVKHKSFSFGICHAETDGVDWQESRDNPDSKAVMVWGRRILRGDKKVPSIDGVDITIHGHTPLELPQWVENRYFIDTGAWYSDVLTLRNVEDIYAEYNLKRSVFE